MEGFIPFIMSQMEALSLENGPDGMSGFYLLEINKKGL
jgi:hypothetical protein